jgi:hypothetical protein
MATIFKAWLEYCDKNHECRHGLALDESGKQELPSRLLNVSPSSNLDEIRLDIKGRTKPEKYIALSYCWGQAPNNNPPPWCTLSGNLEERIRGFKLGSLPQTLRDAVHITRDFGIQYLCINSLCIIQNGHNWNEESKRMEGVFASAYCTIAATAASDFRSGFKKKHLVGSACVRRKTGSDINVSTIAADFDNNINEAPLNKRAWVMQERYFSLRIIHFGENRVYGECGEGVYTEDNILL